MRFAVVAKSRTVRPFSVSTIITVALALSVGSATADEATISFRYDLIPVLTKAGCNSGTCHAKAGGGQNGFELSLLGYETDNDYEHLTRSGRARRLFPAAPEQSLILRKAAGLTPHVGGVRLAAGSTGYETLRNWIRQGMPRQSPGEPELQKIEIQPEHALIQPNEEVQLKVVAKFSDGTQRDVTALSLFESNDIAMGETNETGAVQAGNIPGRFAVMVRFLDQATAFTAAVPLGASVENTPTPSNFVDELVFANLQQLGIPPSEIVNDETYLRRVTLDIAGRLPSDEEREDFIADSSHDKRSKLVEQLLSTPDYADFFANKWTTLLKNRRDARTDITANFAFHAWIRDGLLENKSYDALVRELLAATGTVIANPAVAWYKRVKDPKDQLEDVAQLFLGVRMQCAQCHHHPFERWSQDDYYGFAAFFSQIGRKPAGLAGEDLIFHKRGLAGMKNPKSNELVKPAALGTSVGDIPKDEDPRLRLADWMASSDNPFFAKAVVNRYWKHFFRRGLIEPEDDIRDTNPPTNPDLLAALEDHFLSSRYDLKELVRVIVNSKAYQLSSLPNEHNLVDRQNYSRFYPRRMQAEVMLDAIDRVAGTNTSFANLPVGTRAVALPDNSYNTASPFLKVFGRPENQSVCECERVQAGSLAQALHLINASDIRGKIRSGSGRASKLTNDASELADKVNQLYLAAYSRLPNEEELNTATEYLAEPRTNKDGKPVGEKSSLKENLQDLVWALINTKEFLFNH